MMGVLVNPSSNSLHIIHFHDYRALYEIMTRVGLFSDSTHSIRSGFAPLELFFFPLSPFSSSYFFIFLILSLSSYPFIVIFLLLGTIQLLILFFVFPMNEINAVSRI